MLQIFQKMLMFALLSGTMTSCMKGEYEMQFAPCTEDQISEGDGVCKPKYAKLVSEDCVDPNLAYVASSQRMMMCNGEFKNGTLDLTNLKAENIKSGVSIGGTAGGFAAGCSSDGQIDCLANSLFRAANVSGIAATDLRIGKTLAGISGGLKHCRNASKRSIWENNFSYSGTVFDPLDNIDDFANNGTFPVQAYWGSDNYCSSENWTDVSKASDGVTSKTCSAASDQCQMKDNFTGIIWAKSTMRMDLNNAPYSLGAAQYPCGGTGGNCDPGNTGNVTAPLGGTYAANAQLKWYDAVIVCQRLGVISYGGYNDWRMPTQKEMMQGYIDGIQSMESAFFASFDTTGVGSGYWSGTTISDGIHQVWKWDMGYGSSTSRSKGNSGSGVYNTMCVRGP